MNGCQVIETYNKLLDKFAKVHFLGNFDGCKGEKFGGAGVIFIGHGKHPNHYEEILHHIKRIRNYAVIDRPPLKEIEFPIIPQPRFEDNLVFAKPHHTDRPWYNQHKGGNKNKRNHKR